MIVARRTTLAVVVALVASSVFATFPHHDVPLPPRLTQVEVKQGRTNIALRATLATLKERFIELPVDHFDNGTAETFQNRYWVNSKYYRPGGPVFVYDAGEVNAEVFVGALEENNQKLAVMELAQTYRGVGVLWEHRYYGKSLPFASAINATNGWIPEQWSYLTVQQALQDVVMFANTFKIPAEDMKAVESPSSLHAANSPWVWIGSSYSGVRAALLRVRNPNTIFAAWASSAPVQAQVDMTSYMETIERSLPRNCSADYAAVTRWVDKGLLGSDKKLAQTIKYELVKARRMNATGETPESRALTKADVAKWDDLGAAMILMDPMSQYQYRGLADVLPFCDIVETMGGTVSPTAKGINATYGPEKLFDVFQSAIAQFNYDPDLAHIPVPSDESWPRQWCSEFGYFQASNASSPRNIMTSLLSLDEIQSECNALFPFGSGFSQAGPAVDRILKWGGWNMNPSRTMFTNGELDPWRTLSVNSQENNGPKRKPTDTIPGPNSTTDPSSFFGLTYSQQVHAADMLDYGGNLPGRSAAYAAGLDLFNRSLAEWLPAFAAANHTKSGMSTPRYQLHKRNSC